MNIIIIIVREKYSAEIELTEDDVSEQDYSYAI